MNCSEEALWSLVRKHLQLGQIKEIRVIDTDPDSTDMSYWFDALIDAGNADCCHCDPSITDGVLTLTFSGGD